MNWIKAHKVGSVIILLLLLAIGTEDVAPVVNYYATVLSIFLLVCGAAATIIERIKRRYKELF